jgi:hypothetical protein
MKTDEVDMELNWGSGQVGSGIGEVVFLEGLCRYCTVAARNRTRSGQSKCGICQGPTQGSPVAHPLGLQGDDKPSRIFVS